MPRLDARNDKTDGTKRVWCRPLPRDDRKQAFLPYDPYARIHAAGRADFPSAEFDRVVRDIRHEDPEFWRRGTTARAIQTIAAVLVVSTGFVTWKGWRDAPRLFWAGASVAFAWWMAYWAFPTSRFEIVRRALIARRRCPSCAYSLTALAVEADGCTVCPECGAAWKLAVHGVPE